MNFTKLKISSKLIISTVLFITLGQICTTWYARKHIAEEVEIQAKREMLETSQKYAKHVEVTLTKALSIAETTANALSSMVEQGVSARNTYIDLITKIAETNKEYAGIGFLFEENMPFGDDEMYKGREFYDDTGRNVAYIAIDGNEVVRDTFLDYADEWYNKPKELKKPVIIEPSLDEVNGKQVMIATITAPIFAGGKYIGAVLVDTPLLSLTDFLEKVTILKSGYLFLLSDENVYVAHKNHDLLGKSIFEVNSGFKEYEDQLGSNHPFTFDLFSKNMGELAKYYVTPIAINGTSEKWKMLAAIPEREVYSMIHSVSQDQTLASIVLIIIQYILVVIIARGIANPVSKMTGIMLKIANGNKQIDIPYQNRHDEVGDMAKALNVFKNTAIQADEMHEERKRRDVEVEIDRRKGMLEMAKVFENDVGALVKEVTSSSNYMQKVAVEMSSMINDAMHQSTIGANAAEMASNNVSAMASASEELASSILEISRQVTDSSKIATSAVSRSNETTKTMNDLLVSASKIGEVIDLIKDIAEQTNLLALNATIEAARAGEAGKGFAVVANEVKILASQTGKATEEISSQIIGIQDIVKKAVDDIKNVNKTITEINANTSAIASAVEEQGCATKEISESVIQTSNGASEVSKSIAISDKTIREVANNAVEFQQSSSRLAVQGNQLQEKVASFISKVKKDNWIEG